MNKYTGISCRRVPGDNRPRAIRMTDEEYAWVVAELKARRENSARENTGISSES